MENVNKCWMKVIAITSKGETHSAIIEFRAGESLAAKLLCNGKTDPAQGVGICQSRSGLLQRIEFDVPVLFAEQEGCAAMKPAPGLTPVDDSAYEYMLSPGFCSYKFMDEKRRQFSLTTYGYETIEEILPPVNN
jgi:hypothetical protein